MGSLDSGVMTPHSLIITGRLTRLCRCTEKCETLTLPLNLKSEASPKFPEGHRHQQVGTNTKIEAEMRSIRL